MAISAWPFADSDTTEEQFARLASQWATDGVVAHGDLNVTAGTGMQVNVAAGAAIVGGVMVRSTATEARSIGSAAGSTRIDRVVVRRDFSADTGTIVVKAGTPGSGNPPSLTQTIGGTWEVSLATVTVAPGTVNVTSGMIADDRPKTGVVVRVGTTAQRPAGARVGELFFDTSIGRLINMTADGWTGIGSSWSNVVGKPTEFPPAAHTHGGSDITSGTVPVARLPVGTGANQVASGSHQHSQIVSGSRHFRVASSGGSGHWLRNPATTSDSGYPSWRIGVGIDDVTEWGLLRFTSSIRYKTHVKPLKGALDKILDLRPVTFRSKHDADKGKTLTGLIAEEVAEVIPQVVALDDEQRPDSISLDGLVPYLIAAVQQQQETIDALAGRVAELEANK